MKRKLRNRGFIDAVEVKKKNILHHDAEASFFEAAHPEGSGIYEKAKVLRDIDFIVENSKARDLCVDLGCGTGFVTGFELSRYQTVLAMDISRRMLEVLKTRFKGSDGLDLLVCDAENLALRSEVADMLSVSSVLHHLPRPFRSVREASRILKPGGFIYITREPSDVRFRRFFSFLDVIVIRKFVQFLRCLPIFRSDSSKSSKVVAGLDYSGVDVHYPSGLNVDGLNSFLQANQFEVFSACSYHWIYPTSAKDSLDNALSRTNFVIERIPLSKKLGRYICLIASKPA